jgi:hypothetical protein
MGGRQPNVPLAGRAGKPPAAYCRSSQTHGRTAGENPDEWIALAGRVPEDLPKIIQRHPRQILELLREASGLTAQQIERLRELARRMKKKKGTSEKS